MDLDLAVDLLVGAAFATALVRLRADHPDPASRSATAGLLGVIVGFVLRAAAPTQPLDLLPVALGLLAALGVAVRRDRRPPGPVRRASLTVPMVRTVARTFGASAAVGLVAAGFIAVVGAVSAASAPATSATLASVVGRTSVSTTWRMTFPPDDNPCANTWVVSPVAPTLELLTEPVTPQPATIADAAGSARAGAPGLLAALSLGLGGMVALRTVARTPTADPGRSPTIGLVRALLLAGSWVVAGVVALTVGYTDLVGSDLAPLRDVGWGLTAAGGMATGFGLWVLVTRPWPRRPADEPMKERTLEMSA